MISHSRRFCKILLFICTLMLTTVIFLFSHSQIDHNVLLSKDSTLNGFSVSSADGSIQAKWDSAKASNLQYVRITVKDDAGNLLLEQELDPYLTSFSFFDGVHGSAYVVTAQIILSDNTEALPVSARNLFLEYEKMPDVPFINVQTLTGNNPGYETVQAPADCWGVSITNNNYSTAQTTVIYGGKTVFTNNSEIRVRGNTSAAMSKQPYKLKLNTAANLIDLQASQYAHTDWLLLPANNLNFMVGTETALLCGIAWQPRYCLVNFMLNGNYQGTYWLTESVDVSPHRVDIDYSGYLIEQDAYWWNNTGKTFKVDNQITPMAFTFKYPNGDQISDEEVSPIQQHWNEALYLLRNNEPQYAQHFDIESWAAWLLTHDILGTLDSGGSNMYYYKYSFDNGSKIKMGPAWDFDSIYSMTDSWSKAHTDSHTYFPQLLLQPDFCKTYLDTWENVSDTLVQSIDRKLADYFSKNGDAIYESFYLNTICGHSQKNFDSELDSIHQWFSSRTDWLNGQLTP